MPLARRMNPVDFLDSNVYCSCSVKPPNKAALIECCCNSLFMGTGHLCEQSQGCLDLSCSIPLFGWLFKHCSDDFRNIESFNNITPQYFGAGKGWKH